MNPQVAAPAPPFRRHQLDNGLDLLLLPTDLAVYMAVVVELVAPIMLWLGLGTRLAALALLGMTLVIQTFVYPQAYLTHGLWAIALLLLVKYGAGKLSLDWLLWERNSEPA